MDCANCITAMDYLVNLAAGIAKWLLIAAAATAVAIQLWERRQRKRRPE